MTLEAKIEAVLFWKGEPVKIGDLAKLLDSDKKEITAALEKIEENLTGRGITLSRNGDEVMFYTAPEASDLMKKLSEEEMTRDISKAASEVLALIMYRGPISKRDIDYIRGVNSGYVIRNLMIRDLIERIEDKEGRSFQYQPTFELLAHIGVSKRENLPDFEKIGAELDAFAGSAIQTEEK